MAKQEEYTDFIIGHLTAGNVDAKNIISEFCTKFQKTERTFWTQWKIAEEKYRKSKLEAKKEIESKYKDQIEDGLKEGLNRKQHKQAILKKIIDGELEIEKLIIVKGEVKKVKAKPDAQDIMKAIDLDNKMEGDYAPIKNEHSGNLDLKATKIIIE